ncbi:hypothetical protein QP185_04450 [Sphingomonas aerolata]|uniref:hypothetical protein n=1 Tax=Sphingomonas aerolata TaxID=185951 RepID=UPI002FE4187D
MILGRRVAQLEVHVDIDREGIGERLDGLVIARLRPPRSSSGMTSARASAWLFALMLRATASTEQAGGQCGAGADSAQA